MAVQVDESSKNEVSSSIEITHSASSAGQENDKKRNFPGYNLYIKNLDDSFTDATLREAFDPFGTITSAKVMCDDAGKSKGFGFVCFTTPEEANKARTKMNGRIVGTKPLYVAMAQKKEDRKQYLSDKYKHLRISPTNSTISPPNMILHPVVQTTNDSVPLSLSSNSSVVNSNVQLNNMLWRSNLPLTYVLPTNQPVTYLPTSYQPFMLFPNINLLPQAPPPASPIPIVYRPIYLHSSKTNTLIYSTGVQANGRQIPSPGMQVYTTVPGSSEQAAVTVRTVHVHSTSPQSVDTTSDKISNNSRNFISVGGAQSAVDAETNISNGDSQISHSHYSSKANDI